jgi:cell wall-associated NlpC family hydrolase
MTDPRLTPSNGRVAALDLAGQVEAERYVEGERRRVLVPVADLDRKPGGQRDRQILFGTLVTVLEDRDGWSFVQSLRDSYVGYVRTTALGPARDATHVVATPATHLYETESFKSRDLAHLSFGARVTVLHELKRFWETPDGFIPKSHLRPVSRPFTDPVTVAQMHFGVPYLWGGNSVLGIDCSGLVQAALLACDITCPGDSDLQRAMLGQDLSEAEEARRGDLYFWKGHVGMVVDTETLIHANAHHMAVVYEPLRQATLRIEAQGDGPVIARKRLQT